MCRYLSTQLVLVWRMPGHEHVGWEQRVRTLYQRTRVGLSGKLLDVHVQT